MLTDPVNLTADLIRCESITPKEAGALVLLEELLSKAGFECNRVDRGLVSNLFARWGTGKTLGFNGHTDVVPIGSLSDWSVDPFGAEIKDGFLYGRGSTDMKSGWLHLLLLQLILFRIVPRMDRLYWPLLAMKKVKQ